MVSQGNRDAMEVLFNRYYPRLRYYALKLVGNELEAEDCAQEALLALWQHREKFRSSRISEGEAYMITIIRNKAFNYNRHIRIKSIKKPAIAETIELSQDFVESKVIVEDVFYRIYQVMLELPKAQMQLLKMIYIDGMSTDEIALQLGTTANNIRNRKARVLEKLRTLVIARGYSR